MTFWDDRVLPVLIEKACRSHEILDERRRYVPRAAGEVIELGVGSGLNLALYDPSRVTRVTGIDPSQPLLDRAARRAAVSPVPVSLVKAGAERMPFDAGRFDSAVVTFTLCSVDDVSASLAELRRVLRAGAPVYFVEHGLSPSPSTQRWQRALNPAWRRVSGGCSLDRDAGALFRAAGFALDELDAGASPGLSWMSFKYRGVARRD